MTPLVENGLVAIGSGKCVSMILISAHQIQEWRSFAKLVLGFSRFEKISSTLLRNHFNKSNFQCPCCNKILLNVVQNHPLHHETCNYSVNLLSISNDDRKMRSSQNVSSHGNDYFLEMHHLLNRVCSHNVFPCIISAICSSCQILITDAPAKQSMAKHEDQVTKAAYVTTPKSSLGNYVLHAFRHTAVYPSDQLSLSSATPRRKNKLACTYQRMIGREKTLRY